MKIKFTWVGVIFILLGLIAIAFAGWKFLQSNYFFSLGETPTHELEAEDPPDIKFQQLTQQGGRDPVFIDQGLQLIFQDWQDKLFEVSLKADGPILRELQALDTSMTIDWQGNETWGLVEWQASPESDVVMGKIHKVTYKIVTLKENAWGGSWSTDNKITFLQPVEEAIGLWQMDQEGSKEKLLTVLSDLFAPSYTAWSAVGNRLLIQSAFGTAIYTIKDDAALHTGFIEYAKGSSWSPDGWMLAYRVHGEEEDELWVANLDGAEQKRLYKGVFSDFSWLPDGNLVFFSAGKDGGAACWALNPLTGNRQLLADSSVVFYKPIGPIAVSPAGNALAFEAQDYQIWMLKFLDGE
jgi:hypothetical protein